MILYIHHFVLIKVFSCYGSLIVLEQTSISGQDQINKTVEPRYKEYHNINYAIVFNIIIYWSFSTIYLNNGHQFKSAHKLISRQRNQGKRRHRNGSKEWETTSTTTNCGRASLAPLNTKNVGPFPKVDSRMQQR